MHRAHEAFYLLLLCLCSSYHLWLNLKYLLKTLASFPAPRSGKSAAIMEPRCHASQDLRSPFSSPLAGSRGNSDSHEHVSCGCIEYADLEGTHQDRVPCLRLPHGLHWTRQEQAPLASLGTISPCHPHIRAQVAGLGQEEVGEQGRCTVGGSLCKNQELRKENES